MSHFLDPFAAFDQTALLAPAGERPGRRGPASLPAGEKRLHCVSVRLNARELTQLDSVRGQFQRGTWLRIAALDHLPPSVPEVNAQAWAELARLAANFNQAQASINRGATDDHKTSQLKEIAQAVSALRRQLIGVRP